MNSLSYMKVSITIRGCGPPSVFQRVSVLVSVWSIAQYTPAIDVSGDSIECADQLVGIISHTWQVSLLVL